MSIQVLFFASLRQQVGLASTEIDWQVGDNALSIWQRSTGHEALPSQIRVALNQTYCAPETLVGDGCELAFFPPVTGG